MKKIFVEPDMQRIQLNLRENIAASDEDQDSLHFSKSKERCPLQYSTIYLEDLLNGSVQSVPLEVLLLCMNLNYRTRGTHVPVEEILPYLR